MTEATPPRTIIDVHAHLFPGSVIDFFRTEGGRIELFERNGVPGISLDGRVLHAALPPEIYDVDAHLAGMDRSGVQFHALSVPPPMVYWAEPARGLALAQAANDSMSELAARHPDRLMAVGSVPLQDTDLAVQELERIATKLGHRMIILGSNIDGTELDDPRLEPFWAAAERLDVALFVHPIVDPVVADRMRDYRLDMGFGMTADTTLAISRVICSGLLDRYPGLRFTWSHLGGMLPFIGDRIQYFLEHLPGSTYRAAEPFGSYVRRFWFDSVVYSDRMLTAGLAFARPDRLMFGTDAPFMGDSSTDIRRIIEASPDLSEEDRLAIYHRTAIDFLRLDPARLPWEQSAADPVGS